MICFVSVVSDHYIDMFLTLLYSVKKHNLNLADIRWRILTNPEWCPLSEDNRAKIKKIWGAADFICVDIDSYRGINAKRAIRCFNQQSVSRKTAGGDARTWFMKFAILLFKDVYRAVYLDSDILCVGDISNLVYLDQAFGVVIRKIGGGRAIKKIPHHRFNAGVMVIGRWHMQKKNHDILVNLANKNNRNGDQEAWWDYLNGHVIWALRKHYNRNPVKYNHNTRLIHFWGAKPHEREDKRKADLLWDKYFQEMKGVLNNVNKMEQDT